MKSSGIGGQAVMEGVMMRNGDDYAVAVRLPDGRIQVDQGQYRSFTKGKKILSLPFIRGVFNFIDSLVLGISTLTRSADLAIEAENKGSDRGPDPGDGKQEGTEKKENGENGWMMALTVLIAVAMAVALFMVLPVLVASLLRRWINTTFGITLLEGVIRIAIFLIYVILISRMKDIQRIFMYHGAEHKCINCVEHGLDLTVDNVKQSSRLHKRCGTSFLLIVMVISLFVTMLVQVDTVWLRVLSRILLLPVIAGISYEILRLAGRSDSPVIQAISKPGLMMQKLTTREPDAQMIEVAIQSVEAVFDWKKFVEEVRGEQAENR